MTVSGNPVSNSPLVIAIDGPAGAGKSTITKAVADHLGLLMLDTGAMYRAATVGLIEAGIQMDDEAAVADWVCARSIDFDAAGDVQLDGAVLEDDSIRTPEITAQVYRVAGNDRCRAHMVELQRAIIAGRDSVVEGRDATTVICPDATLKIYLDASPEERARRRLKDWTRGGGKVPSFDEVVASIEERDRRDRERATGALILTDDAVPVHTDGLSPLRVATTIVALAIQRRPLFAERLVDHQLIVGRSRQAGYVRVAEGSINDPPAPWKLGLTNPSNDRMPGLTHTMARNAGGRQAGTLCQGRAMIVLGGCGDHPDRILALPMLPQSWYVIEPGCWHAVIQAPGTICAWAEAAEISEDKCELTGDQREELGGFEAIFLPEG